VALAAVADERDHAAADPFPEHPGHQVPHTPQVRSGGTTCGQTRVFLQLLYGRDTGRVRDRNHQVDHRWNETRLHAGPADPFDARGHARVVVRYARDPPREERGVLRVDNGQTGAQTTVAQIAADGRRGTAGTRPHHDPFRVGVAFHGQLFEDRHGDVVVAAPVGGPFGVGELVHVVAVGL